MADIRLRIEVNPDGETEFGKNDGKEKIGNIVNDNAILSNVSYKTEVKDEQDVFSITTIKESGREMLSWANNGVLKFNSEGKLSTDGINAGALASESNPDMFVWGAVPSSKQYSVKLTFSNATSLKDIVVYGDKTANQFPTKAIIDGTKTIYSDDYQWAINMEEESDTHTIEFVEWNRANYNACLTKIMVMLRYFDLDKGWINSVESLTQSTSDASSIQYGILANSGSSTIYDLNGELADYINDGIIPQSNVDVKLIVNGNQIQEHLTSDTNYIKSEKKLSLSMTNDINNWDKINFAGYTIRDCRDFQERYGYEEYYTLYEVLCWIFADCLNLSNSDVDLLLESGVKEYLQNIHLFTIYMDSGTLTSAINKVCEIAQLNVIQTNEGLVKFCFARPTVKSSKTKIKIEHKYQISELKSDLFVKNKFNGVQSSKIVYNRVDTILQPLENKSGDFETLQAYIKSGSFWFSDYFSDENAITQSGYYTIIDFTDVQNRNWKICYKEESLNSYIRCLGKIYQPKDSLSTANTRPMLTFLADKNYTTNLVQISTFDDLEHFKTFLHSTDKKYYGGFLGNKYSPINPYLGQYVKTIRPIFAYQTTVTFPMQIFFTSSIVDSTTGLKTLVKETVSIDSANEIVSNSINSNLVELNDNELISNDTTYNNQSILSVIGSNIISDYKNGISTATIDLFIGDLYDSNGNKIKDWSKGEILDIGDIIYFEDDKYADGTQRYWRVTGRKFVYNGSPTLSLELQEVIIV